jgi:hypothetical protein
MLDQPIQQAHLTILLVRQSMTQPMAERQCAQRPYRVDEERVRAVEGMDEPSAGNGRPPTRLHGAAHLQRELVKVHLPI